MASQHAHKLPITIDSDEDADLNISSKIDLSEKFFSLAESNQLSLINAVSKGLEKSILNLNPGHKGAAIDMSPFSGDGVKELPLNVEFIVETEFDNGSLSSVEVDGKFDLRWQFLSDADKACILLSMYFTLRGVCMMIVCASENRASSKVVH